MLALFAVFFLISVVSGTSRHKHRQSQSTNLNVAPISGKFDSVSTGQYSLLNNLWGEQDANPGGSQTSQLISISGNVIGWETSWAWSGGPYQVKSYANIQLDVGINQQLSAISSMPSIWQWSQAPSGTVVADVAYDLFTSYAPGGGAVNEIMIWLANFNAGPISAQYNATGDAVPIATGIQIANYTWELYSGNNGVNQVYSFLLSSGVVTSFSGDIYQFISYLIDNEGMSESQYLITAQAGTEATSGAATLTTSSYSLSIN